MLGLNFAKICHHLRHFGLLVLAFWLQLALLTTPAFAQATPTDGSDNFDIRLHSTYTVTATGRTLVEQKFTIKNKTPELFVSKYGIVVSSTHLSNITVTHNGQALEPEIQKVPGQTSVAATFSEPVVGEGKSHELVISYSDQDIALISGKILEVNIPQLNDQYQYQNYQVELRVPSIFNTPSRINPSTFTLRQEGDYNVISYANLGEQSISAIFGHQQLFDLKLSYYLHNPTSQTALTQITLPPETPLQQVHYLSLEPPPKSIKEDADGNFIATYEVPANQSFQVELLSQIKLHLQAQTDPPASPVLAEHTLPAKFWDSQDPSIQELANSLVDIKAIYDYTVDTLRYTTRPLDQFFERLGAKTALQDRYRFDATCQEYTDLFIALARSQGIPSRRVVGIAYSNNEELRPSNLQTDILHTWPEYYDTEQRAWISVDPTWESTTGGVDYFHNFDLNHITLAINGVSSSLPHPAGGQVGASDETAKKIYLDFAKSEQALPNPQLDLQVLPQKISGLSLPGSYELHISNQTGKTWYLSEIELQAQGLGVTIDQHPLPNKILPFAKLILPLSVYNTTSDHFGTVPLTVTIVLRGGQTITHDSNVAPSFQLSRIQPRQLLVVGGGLIGLTGLTWGLFLLGRQVTSALRRQGEKLEKQDQQLQVFSTALQENQPHDTAGPKSQVSSPKQRA